MARVPRVPQLEITGRHWGVFGIVVMQYAQHSVAEARADPRILKIQVERAAKAIRGTIISSPVWACFAAYFCSEFFPFLGSVPINRSLVLVIVVSIGAAVAQFVLNAFHRG